MFALAINATGIDQRRDRVVKLAAVDLLHPDRTFVQPVYQLPSLVPTQVCYDIGLPLQSIQRARRFPDVWQAFVGWMDEPNPTLTAQNGHHFVFPLLTKEMRRYRITIDRPFILWDYHYSLPDAPPSPPSPMDCQQALKATLDRFHHEGLSIEDLRRDNETSIRKNPQEPFQTSHMRVN